MRDLVRYLTGYEKECILAPLFKLLEAAFQLATPLVVSEIVDRGIQASDTDYIAACGCLLVGLACIGFCCAVFAQYFSAKLASGFGTRLRNDLFAHVATLSQNELDKLGQATLITRITNDSLQVQSGVNMFFRLILRSPFVVGGCLVMAFTIDGTQGLIFVVTIALLSVAVVLLMRIPVKSFGVVQATLDTIQSRVHENLRGVRTIRAFRREAFEQACFHREADELYAKQVYAARISALMNPITYVGINLCLIAVIATGAVQVATASLTTGAVVALVNYVAQILTELVKLVDFVGLMARSIASAQRLQELRAMHSSMQQGTVDVLPWDVLPLQASPTPSEHGGRSQPPRDVSSRDALSRQASLSMCDVSFSYPDAGAPALQHISVSIPAGGVLGVIGGTGSGKTTLASLIMREYDVSEGMIAVGDCDVRNFTFAALHRTVGVVQQGAPLFSGTIADNIRWGKFDATDDELMCALRQAQADDVIASREDGLYAYIEEGGKNLSGGQRQRLSIARTLVAEPQLLVLDDATSALDFATEARLRRVLAKELHDTTKVIISQRVSAIRHADVILVLDEGKQVGCGTHDDLVQSCPVYRQICLSQLSEEEVLS